MLFSLWLTSLCMAVSRSFHVFASGTVLFPFMTQQFSTVGFPGGAVVKKKKKKKKKQNCLPVEETQETWVRPLGWKDPWRRKWQPTPVYLPGKSYGQRILVVYRVGHNLGTGKKQQCSIVYMYHVFFTSYFYDGHLGCFHILTIGNSAAMNTGVHAFF